MRWIAGGLVVFGCGYLGISFAGGLERRIRQLEILEQLFRQLEFNIVFLLRPFPEALKSVADSHKGPMGTLFSGIADCVTRKPDLSPEKAFQFVLDDAENVHLKKEEQEILGDFFRHIGAGDREKAGDGIRVTVAKLRSLHEQVTAEQKKDGKLWRSMGFLSGIFIVLLLM